MVMMVMLAMTVVLGCELVSVRRSFSWSDCCLQEISKLAAGGLDLGGVFSREGTGFPRVFMQTPGTRQTEGEVAWAWISGF